MTIEKIVERARRTKRIRDGLVLCDNCDTPASAQYSKACGWTGCGPCMTGEADALDPEDFIVASTKRIRDGLEGCSDAA